MKVKKKKVFLSIAKLAVDSAAHALTLLADNLPPHFELVVEEILALKGRVILVGMGKSGYIARKIASSLASTGTPAFYVHPGEASHGDLGMICESDLVIMLSNSGETKELIDTINYCKRYNIPIIGMTMRINSMLANNSSYVFLIPEYNEASNISAPTTSTLLMLALGDALVIALHEARGICTETYRIFHPGGKIGVNLLQVKHLMYTGAKIPIVDMNTSFMEVILIMTKKSLGCAIVTEDDKLIGIITDGDLRRHINEDLRNKVAFEIMTPSPLSINEEMLVGETLFIMNDQEITTLPVTKDEKVIGIIHIHDLLRIGVG